MVSRRRRAGKLGCCLVVIAVRTAKELAMKKISWIALALVIATAAVADDRETYSLRAAETDLAAFRQLDLNRDGMLTQDEVLADLNFAPRFNDMDINRDGIVTPEELRRYIERAYGVLVTEGNQLVRQLPPPSGR
jgi:hypothetical protein